MVQVPWDLPAEGAEEVGQDGVVWVVDTVIGGGMDMAVHMVVTILTDTAIGATVLTEEDTDTEAWPGVRHLEVASTTALQGAEVLKEANGRSPIKGFYRKNRGSIIAYIFLS